MLFKPKDFKMKKLVLCMFVVSAMFIISCGGKDWKTSVSGKTFTATNGVSMVFDSNANISLNLGIDDETNEMAKALTAGIQNSIVIKYIDSPNKTNAIYEIEVIGAKTYASYSLNGDNLYIYQNDVITNTNDLNWDETTEEVYILK